MYFNLNLAGYKVVLAIVFAALLMTQSVSSADERPSFILLMGDDHGWSETGYNGHPYVKTPVLDDMAAKALRLDNFYAGHPTCSPTRASVMTGRHPNRMGTFHPGWSIRPEEITIAHLLSDAGYHCGHFGKWHLGPVKADSPTNPRAMGFDEYLSHDNFYEMDPQFSRNGGPPKTFPGEGSMVTIDQTLAFIEQAIKRDKPFLAVVWFGSPHEPYSGLPDDLAMYDELPAELDQRTVRLTSMETGKPTTRSLRAVLRERYAEITAMDRAIGKLRNRLSELGQRDNTVVWYCGDNGNPPSSGRVGTPLRGQKGTMFEGGIRVPGLIEWPARIKSPRSSDVNGITSDMLPTLCDLAKVSKPDRPLDGISLVKLIDGEMTQRNQPIGFWRYSSQQLLKREPPPRPYFAAELQQGTTPLVKYMAGKLTRSFRNVHQPSIVEADYVGPRVLLDDHYKLVVQSNSDGEVFSLYDLNADLAEQTDLSEQDPERTQAMKEALRRWQSSVLNSLTEADY